MFKRATTECVQVLAKKLKGWEGWSAPETSWSSLKAPKNHQCNWLQELAERRSRITRVFKSRYFGDISDELAGCLISFVINLAFVGVVALVMWPVRAEHLTLRLAKGYGIFWIVAVITALVLNRIQQFFRVDTDSHFDAYVISNLGHSVILLVGWSAFAVLLVYDFVNGKPLWAVILFWVVGLLSSWIAYTVLTSFYPGQVYSLTNLFAALVSFLAFALWPKGGRMLFGWFFNLF